MAKVLVIGYGNPLRGDDCFGHRAVQKLQEEIHAADVEFLECQQLTPELAERVSKTDLVLFVDADMDGVAGTIHSRKITAKSNPSSEALVHHLDPAGLVGLSKALYRVEPEALLMTVTGECFGYGAQLTPEVERALPGVVQHMKELILERMPAAV